MQILPVYNYSKNVYSNKNITKKSSYVNFCGTNSISKETFKESKKLAEQAIELCKHLFGKFPKIGDVALMPKEYAVRAWEGFEYKKFEKPTLTLCKKYGNKEAILYIEQPPRYYEAPMGAGTVNLFIRKGTQYPTNITFNKTFPKNKNYSEVIEMTSKKGSKDVFSGITSKIVDASEEDAQIFNKYVSDILESSNKLVEVFK